MLSFFYSTVQLPTPCMASVEVLEFKKSGNKVEIKVDFYPLPEKIKIMQPIRIWKPKFKYSIVVVRILFTQFAAIHCVSVWPVLPAVFLFVTLS